MRTFVLSSRNLALVSCGAAVLVALTACSQDYSVGDIETPVEPTPVPDPEPQPTPPPVPNPDPDPVTPPPAAQAPVAVCSVTEQTMLPIHDAANFDGSQSYDPGGLEIVSYDWTLSEKPAGSSAEMPGGGAIRSGFIADQAGLYVGRLTVTNSAGVTSDACEAEVEAIPAESLWVEMFWDQPGDDMDLHLLAPNGTIGTTLDCYYGNCKPTATPLDWGVANFADDNPTLDRDDVSGTGPENINILAPSNGIFTVAVKDFGSDPTIASTTVTVNIYIDAALVWTDTRTIVGDPTAAVEFAEIDWPSGIVTSL
ncbi:MAG: hypothetical protein H6734_11705 [Alphaproteobacteria bacterium]|nr:hypothetical protein [Alphaproteobacteria bacterium]